MYLTMRVHAVVAALPLDFAGGDADASGRTRIKIRYIIVSYGSLLVCFAVRAGQG